MTPNSDRLKKCETFFLSSVFFSNSKTEGYSELCQTSKIERYAKIVNGF